MIEKNRRKAIVTELARGVLFVCLFVLPFTLSSCFSDVAISFSLFLFYFRFFNVSGEINWVFAERNKSMCFSGVFWSYLFSFMSQCFRSMHSISSVNCRNTNLNEDMIFLIFTGQILKFSNWTQIPTNHLNLKNYCFTLTIVLHVLLLFTVLPLM